MHTSEETDRDGRRRRGGLLPTGSPARLSPLLLAWVLASCGQEQAEAPAPAPPVRATEAELAWADEQHTEAVSRLGAAFSMRPTHPVEGEERRLLVRDLELYLLLTGPTAADEPTGEAHLVQLGHWLHASVWEAPEQDALMGWARALGHGHERFERDAGLVERAREGLRLVAPLHGVLWLIERCPPSDAPATLDSMLGIEPEQESWLEPRGASVRVEPHNTPGCYESTIRDLLTPPARVRSESWVVGPIDLEPLEQLRGAYFSNYGRDWVQFARYLTVRAPRAGDVEATRRMLEYFAPVEGDSPHRRLYTALGRVSWLTPPVREPPSSLDSIGPLRAADARLMVERLSIDRSASRPDHLEVYEAHLAELRDGVREPLAERRRRAALANAHVDRMLEDNAQRSRRSEIGRRVDLSFNAMHERLLRGPIQAFEALR